MNIMLKLPVLFSYRLSIFVGVGAGMDIKKSECIMANAYNPSGVLGQKNDDAIHLSNAVLCGETLQIHPCSLGAFKECGWRQMQGPNLFGR